MRRCVRVGKHGRTGGRAGGQAHPRTTRPGRTHARTRDDTAAVRAWSTSVKKADAATTYALTSSHTNRSCTPVQHRVMPCSAAIRHDRSQPPALTRAPQSNSLQSKGRLAERGRTPHCRCCKRRLVVSPYIRSAHLRSPARPSQASASHRRRCDSLRCARSHSRLTGLTGSGQHVGRSSMGYLALHLLLQCANRGGAVWTAYDELDFRRVVGR